MSQGAHRKFRRHRSRIVAGVAGLATCVGIAVGVSAVAAPANGLQAKIRPLVSTTQLQYDLAGLAYLPWSGVDGATGPQTTAATEAFQADACIAADGVDGPQTDAALSAKVKQVQAVVGATQDGAFGSATKAAVASWQSAHGLTADGQAGPTTMSAMGIARTSCAPPPPPPPPPSGTLAQNIATIAGQELANPAHNHESGGYNCNYYSGALGVGGACSNGWRTEEWCADFALWVWRGAGATIGGLNAGAISFYNYGVSHGTWHTSGPQVGDAVVFNVSGGSASHVGLVVSASGSSFSMISGNSLSSDGQDDAVTKVNLTTSSSGVSGFAGPVG